jgi:putative DNA primase/helicase
VKDFQKIVYDMYGGTGKGVMDQNRELKEVRTWRIIVLSSGELSTFDKSKESGAPINAGQLIRFKDIPIEGKIVENAIDAEAIKYACSQFYGTAGPAFVQALIDEIKDWETMHTTIGEMMKTAIEKMPKTADALQARGLKHFALAKVAGVLAKRYLDLPLTEDEITNSVSKIAKIWMDNSGSLSDTDRAIIKLRNLIQTDGESRFRRLPGDERAQIINQAGWWDLNKKIVYINEATFTDEICAGLSYREVANALCEKGLLNRSGTHLQTELGATIKCWAERDESAKKSPSINRIKKVRAFSINDSIVNYGIEGST